MKLVHVFTSSIYQLAKIQNLRKRPKEIQNSRETTGQNKMEIHIFQSDHYVSANPNLEVFYILSCSEYSCFFFCVLLRKSRHIDHVHNFEPVYKNIHR